MKLYSKDNATGLISSMIKNSRLSHSFIICGEKGVGKKTLANHLAAQILCQEGRGEACGVCKSCRMAKNNAHPDLITLVPSGKSGNFRADDLRPLISDASITPNEGVYKVYILPLIDKALPAAQNTLLKIVEEPPANVVFIMTAAAKEGVLQTILSRSIVLNIGKATDDECLEALVAKGYDEADAKKAVDAFGGNIGACLEFLSSDSEDYPFEAVKAIASALIKGDEYLLAKELSNLDKDKAYATQALGLLETVIRDALMSKSGAKLVSSCKAEAETLGENVRQSGLIKMYEAIGEAIKKINGNSNVQLALNDLCCRLRTYSLQ